MFGLHGLSKVKRLILGICVLLVVDLIWVASSELTEYIFKDAHFDKPFFTTYVKTSMFSVYLLGFLIFEPWRSQCKKSGTKNTPMTINSNDIEGDSSQDVLSEPQYVPAKFDDKASGTESDDSVFSSSENSLRVAQGRVLRIWPMRQKVALRGKELSRSVRFSKVNEVRQLSEAYAEEALIARLSYSASLRAEESRLRAMSKLTVKQVAKLALLFCLLWFVGNFSYQEALKDTEAGIVNVLSSTSGLFTLICAAIYPSSSADRFTLSKLSAVLLSFGGIVMVSLADLRFEDQIPVGALWALCGSMLYALYLVSLRRRVDHEDKLDITMFFGFVGLLCVLLLWPGFFVLHFSGSEVFVMPDSRQWLFIAINGLVGTVLSEVLWLWGCFLTSSLIATLALSLTIPLTMMADVLWKGVNYNWLFYVGSIPVFIAFFAVSLLTHYETWDPVLLCFKKILHCFCRRRLLPRVREMDREQTESLIESSS